MLEARGEGADGGTRSAADVEYRVEFSTGRGVPGKKRVVYCGVVVEAELCVGGRFGWGEGAESCFRGGCGGHLGERAEDVTSRMTVELV